LEPPVPCLDEDTIIDLLAGRLKLDAPGVEEHLQTCAACALLVGTVAADLDAAEAALTSPAVSAAPQAGPLSTVHLPLRGTFKEGAFLNETYRVLRLIGRGGMGEVYEVRHARLSGRYAAKILRAEVSGDEELLCRFRREAEITSELRHPNIVQVIDFDRTPDGHFFLAMECLEGCDLAALLRRERRLPFERAIRILRQIVSALAAAHRRGIIHRDLKPGNVFIGHGDESSEETVKLMDFGLSKWSRSAPDLSMLRSQDNALIGTPLYMAPEQARGKNRDVSAATDQFALAAILHEMLTGAPPFSGTSVAQVLYGITYEPAPSLATLCPELPARVGQAVLRALSKAQSDRFSSVQAFLGAIEQEEAVPRPGLHRKRGFGRVALAAAVAAGGGAAAVSVWQSSSALRGVALTRTSAVDEMPAGTVDGSLGRQEESGKAREASVRSESSAADGGENLRNGAMAAKRPPMKQPRKPTERRSTRSESMVNPPTPDANRGVEQATSETQISNHDGREESESDAGAERRPSVAPDSPLKHIITDPNL
jgi:serine/threonine protein kinase